MSTITVRLNGAEVELPNGSTIVDLLRQQGLSDKRVAVECNRDIVPKSRHAAHLLQHGDQLELVHALGGG
jgi:sulfur carrier protein